ncbi:hypothetical protein ACFS5J_03095 [Flavobacterium chuncheonense]|uniref:Uncharacterized protein n=1 Tax=Flavobacterium chuncheonense TaxID=2026653 RepID=A0ABW5YKF5_9FLAO
MAKQHSILKVEGTLDGLTFYKSIDGHLVRMKGGVSKSRIMKDPAYVRTRENIAEFGATAQAGKLIRNTITTVLQRAKDPRLSSRMLSVLHRIKNLDTNSVRGARKVGEGLQTPTGKALLKGFNFNQRALLQTILHAPYTLSTTTGVVSFADLVPLEHILSPEGATHVGFRTAFVNLDMATGLFDTQLSAVVHLPLDMTVANVVLTPTAVPAGNGLQLHFLLLEFFQLVNGMQYPLHDGAFNSLSVLDVI